MGRAARTAAARVLPVHRRGQADLRRPDQPRIDRPARAIGAPLPPQRRRRRESQCRRDAARPRPDLAHRRPGPALHLRATNGSGRSESGLPGGSQIGRLIVAVYEFPTSFSQRRMWLLAEMDPGEPTYNITWALWLEGSLEVSALQRAWDAAVARHETLRTTFRNQVGVPVQVIEDEPAGRPLPVTSVEQLAAGERETAALDQIGKLARIPFDLATGPLARAALVRLSPEAHVLA